MLMLKTDLKLWDIKSEDSEAGVVSHKDEWIRFEGQRSRLHRDHVSSNKHFVGIFLLLCMDVFNDTPSQLLITMWHWWHLQGWVQRQHFLEVCCYGEGIVIDSLPPKTLVVSGTIAVRWIIIIIVFGLCESSVWWGLVVFPSYHSNTSVISQLPKLCKRIEYWCIEYLIFILWLRSFITRLLSVIFAEEKVLIFLIFREKC